MCVRPACLLPPWAPTDLSQGFRPSVQRRPPLWSVNFLPSCRHSRALLLLLLLLLLLSIGCEHFLLVSSLKLAGISHRHSFIVPPINNNAVRSPIYCHNFVPDVVCPCCIVASEFDDGAIINAISGKFSFERILSSPLFSCILLLPLSNRLLVLYLYMYI